MGYVTTYLKAIAMKCWGTWTVDGQPFDGKISDPAGCSHVLSPLSPPIKLPVTWPAPTSHTPPCDSAEPISTKFHQDA